MRNLVAMVALLGMFGCQASADDNVETGEQTIIGGDSFVQEFGSVAAMFIKLPPDDQGNSRDPIWCAGTLVDSRTVLTAASCLWDNVEQNKISPTDVTINNFGFPVVTTNFEIEEVFFHRYFDPDGGGQNDLALVRLKSAVPAGVAPAVLSERALVDSDIVSDANCDPDGNDIGNSDVPGCATMVGFGETDDTKADFGARLKVVTPLQLIAERHVLAGTQTSTTCLGDSGAPVFMDFGAGLVLVAISESQINCRTSVRRTRVDKYVTEFIYPYLDRFSGNCPIDGTCTTTGCRSADPDCDDCLTGNACKEDCPTRDWDCTVGKFLGDTCTADGECEENGRCVTARDDDAFTFCSRPCDPADAGSCPAAYECLDLGGGVGECSYTAPSPGSQGASCVFSTDCRSDICEETICVNTCDTQADCAEGFTCGPSQVKAGANVCLGEVLSGGGGFCDASQSGRGAGAALLLVLLALGAATRRRRE